LIKITKAVIVEGKYDKIKLSSLLDAIIIDTEGFGIFKDKEKQRLIMRLAEKYGLLVLTDSDAAGFKIRSFIGGCVPPGQICHAYIPDIFGKEKRKPRPSKEGKLGVEGVEAEVLRGILERCGAAPAPSVEQRREITFADLYADGLSGSALSKQVRAAFLKKAGLPARLSIKSMYQVINSLMTYQEYKQMLEELKKEAVHDDENRPRL